MAKRKTIYQKAFSLIAGVTVGYIGMDYYLRWSKKKATEKRKEDRNKPDLGLDMSIYEGRETFTGNMPAEVKGFPFPSEISKIQFPVSVVTLPDTNFLGRVGGWGFRVDADISNNLIIFEARVDGSNRQFAIPYDEFRSIAVMRNNKNIIS